MCKNCFFFAYTVFNSNGLHNEQIQKIKERKVNSNSWCML